MWKVLLVIASVVLAGTAYLSYDNMGTFKQRLLDVDTEKSTLADRTAALEKTNVEITALEQSILMLATETETLQTQKIDADGKVVEAESNQKAQQAKLDTAKADLEKAKELIKDIAGIEAIQKEMVQIRTQVEESEIEVTELEGAVAAAQVDRDRFEKVAAELAALRTDQEAGVIRGEFQSQIKKAYNQWGFVVVAGGNDQGVVNRAQMDVYRRGQPICRLLVTSVEANETVADIVAGSLAPGQSVQVGDTVVKSVRVQTPAVIPASAPAGGAAPAPGGAAAPAALDPVGGMAPAPASAPAAPDPFGGSAPATPAGMPPDPFGGGMAPAPGAPATPEAPATPDPFGAPAPAPGAAPAPAPGSTPAPDPFGAPPTPAPGATPPPAPGAAPAP